MAKAKDVLVMIEYQGEARTLKEWSKVLNLDWDSLRMRYRRGLTGEKLFTETKGSSIASVSVSFRGDNKTIKEWSKELNMPLDTLKTRYIRGKRGDDLFTEYERRKRGKTRTTGWESRLDEVMKLREMTKK